MGVGAFIEPLVVVTLLFGGTWINRNTNYTMSRHSKRRNARTSTTDLRDSSPDSLESGINSPIMTDSLLSDADMRSASPSLLWPQESKWRKRELRFLGFKTEVTTPNTRRFQGRLMSRLLQKYPFLVEAWYWALIYWVYQLGRAFTAVTLVEGTVHVARKHALQLIRLEQRLHLFHELPIQHWFLAHPLLMHWTNRIYSFIHIPATILFLVWLYYYTTTRTNRLSLPLPTNATHDSLTGPRLYEARRRTMAMCNLLAFIVFTAWPCMPPRLLSDPSVTGPSGEVARQYGFVDTVHGGAGEGSVWTTNRFCNQYAAMPSLHFGYSLLIGLTICSIPLVPQHQRGRRALSLRLPGTAGGWGVRVRVLEWRRVACLVVGVGYPTVILAAIIATANHFILDAVAGAVVCGVAWRGNQVLLNLRAAEDWLLWCLRVCKPERRESDEEWDCEWEGEVLMGRKDGGDIF